MQFVSRLVARTVTAAVKISELPAAAAANDADQLEINQAGTSRRLTVAQVAAAIVPPPLPPQAGVEYLPFLTGTAAENTASIQAALTRLAAIGGGTLQLPPGEIPYTALATQVGPDDGAAWMLTAGYSNIAIRGAGKGVTVLKPASGRVEGFVQNGAANLRFEGITFDNSDNGVLQGGVAIGNPLPGTGFAGMGNQTNAAIDQFEGAGLTVVDCEFIEFTFAVHYIGSLADNQALVGDLIVDRCRFNGCVQGVICHQPRTVHFTNSDYSNGISSLDSGGGLAGGHGIYVTDRTGAYPDTINVSGITGTDNLDTNVRVRKGKVVTVTNCPHFDAVRGHNFENCNNLTVSNLAIKMRFDAADDVPWGLVIVDCGFYEISNVVIDCSGTSALAVNIQPSGSSVNSWANSNGVLRDITVIHDLAGPFADNHPWISLIGQTDVTVRNCTGFLTANTAQNRRFIEFASCTRCHAVRPSKRAAAVGNPAGSHRLVTIQANSTDCSVEWSSMDVDFVSTDNVSDLGAGTRVSRIEGATNGSWVPAPTFATPGDFSPAISIAQGRWVRLGNTVWLTCALFFDTNAYTTAAGTFLLGGIPFPARGSGGIRYTAALGSHSMLHLIGTDVAVWLDVGASQASFRMSLTDAPGNSLTGAQVPPGISGIGIYFTILYEAQAS